MAGNTEFLAEKTLSKQELAHERLA